MERSLNSSIHLEKLHINVCKYVEYLWQGTENTMTHTNFQGRGRVAGGVSGEPHSLCTCMCFYSVWVLPQEDMSAVSPGEELFGKT